jgi:ATP-dependent exoDNAse (exonuclease V) beta subunit
MPETSDQAARNRIGTDLGSTLFVEAGAGTGKTSALVNRIVELVVSGVPMEHIAAITFTDRAATELRDRVRRRLEHLADEDPHAGVAAAALIELDGAALCTLHAFAQRILIEHPIEAGLPPAVEVMDEVSSLVDFDERWDSLVHTLLGDPDLAFTMLAGLELGISLDHIRRLAVRFDENWDQVDERLVATPDPLPVDVLAIIDSLRPLVDLGDHCIEADDKMAIQLEMVGAYADEFEAVAHDPLSAIRVLGDRKVVSNSTRLGNQKNWTGAVPIGDVRDQMQDARTLLDAEVTHLTDQVIDRIVSVVGAASVAAASRRQRQGQLSFHDLLVLARRSLTNEATGPSVRAALHDRYRHLLLDEFQDTDPIQIELTALIADPDTITDDWRQLRPPPGSLFFVGDPKQSIYGFRRANIALYLDAQHAFGKEGVRLEQNFRTTGPILAWVNDVFSRLIAEEPHAQPEYAPLTSTRPAATVGPAVTLLGFDSDHKRTATQLQLDDITDVVAAVTTALADGWTVWRAAPDPNGGPPIEGWHPCTPGDIAILVRSRKPVADLAAALAGAGVPHRIEAGTNPWAADEVRDILMALQAIDDPTDELALVTALRSPLFGCGDDDLLAFHLGGGNWDHQQPGTSGLPADQPVVSGMAWMARMHTQRPWAGAANLVEQVVRDRRAMELALCGNRPRDAWRRIRTFLDTARSYGEARGGDLRSFLSWCRLHTADDVCVDEVIPPESDDDAVRILTTHAAKGLEFPICVLSDLGAKRPTGGHTVAFPGSVASGTGPDNRAAVAVAFNKDLTNSAHRAHSGSALRLEHLERLRLLYVGATRARDHLIISLHRSTPKSDPENPVNVTSAEVLHSATAGTDPTDTVAHLKPTARDLSMPPAPETAPLPTPDEWRADADRIRFHGARRRTVAATTIAVEASPVVDEESEQARQGEAGRHGTGVGRAVHAALEVVDMASAGEPEARHAAAAEDVDPGLVASMVAAALASPSVVEAARSEHWRELFVAAPLSTDLLLEGYIDLAYRTDSGLVVIDYKTDSWNDEEDLSAKVTRYRLQGAAYALALQKATGTRVERMAFCFLGSGSAVERDVPNLDAAMSEVEAWAVTATSEGT